MAKGPRELTTQEITTPKITPGIPNRYIPALDRLTMEQILHEVTTDPDP
jgi:hypothetical protein